MKKERAEFTAKYEAGEVAFKRVDLREFMVCTCLSFQYPHTLDAHQKLKSDYDWRPFEVRERQDISSFREWGAIR